MPVKMKRNNCSAAPSWGFTLIELLVVIAIIAILAAILFPVFAKAREKARQTACLSNMKQISLGLMQYTSDYDEWVPYVWYIGGGGTSATGNYKWMDAVYPYIKSEAVFNCPDAVFPYNQVTPAGNFYQYKYKDNLASASPAAAADNAITGNFYYGTYGYNAMYRNDLSTGGRTPPCGNYNIRGENTAQYPVPASTVWIVDSTNYVAGLPQFAIRPSVIVNHTVSPIRFNPVPSSGSDGTNELVIGRHSDFANVIFCDGHVKAMTLDELGKRNPNTTAGTLYYFTIQDDAP